MILEHPVAMMCYRVYSIEKLIIIFAIAIRQSKVFLDVCNAMKVKWSVDTNHMNYKCDGQKKTFCNWVDSGETILGLLTFYVD